MTIRNLDFLFKPRSVALIGASKQEQSVGAVLARNLLEGGLDGPVLPVNPRHQHIHSVTTYPTIDALPTVPDLAVIATPKETVPEIIATLGAAGTKAAVVVTAGFGEGRDAGGASLRQAMLDASKPHLLRIVGPNCLGVTVPSVGLNASFAQTAPLPGRLAFVAQSGAIVTSVVDWATDRGIGFSHLVSLGDMADVDFGDMLDYLANQRECRAILLYVEAVTHTRKFMSAARAAARSKPVIVIKTGRYAEGARAVASHTGALAGSDAVYDTAFRRAGMLRVYSLAELFAAVETLSAIDPPKDDRLAIVTNGGGMGILATDTLMEQNGQLATLSKETIARLGAVLPDTWSHANPIDIVGDANAERYGRTVDALLEDPDVQTVLVLHCPTAISSGVQSAAAVIASAASHPRATVLTCWVGGASAFRARALFAEHGLPTYETPHEAVRAFTHMVAYRHNQKTLMEVPPSIAEEFEPDRAQVRAIVDRALDATTSWLTEPQAKAVLAAYAIPTITSEIAPNPKAAAEIAARLGGPVAVKILSPDITHKSDVGGVLLDLVGPRAVEAAAGAMIERIHAHHPGARLEGFTVAPMVERPGAYELILGAALDPQFGPILLFGQGGTAAELIQDRAIALPPLNLALAREVMERTRIYRLLRGFRDRSAVDLDAIAMTLIKLSQLIIDFPEVQELDINPLLADEYGVVALDARIRVAPATAPGTARLAIRPYPKELEETVSLPDGRTLLIRPVVPEDEPCFHAAFATLTPEEIRMRFFTPMKRLTHVQAARFTQIDYDREMALVLTDPVQPGTGEIHGVVRIVADPDNERAEFAIIVHHDFTGHGLGRHLMERILAHARQRGIGDVYASVLRENVPMLRLAQSLGFAQTNDPEEADTVHITVRP